jgi:hypothetical protein
VRHFAPRSRRIVNATKEAAMDEVTTTRLAVRQQQASRATLIG